MKKTAKTITLRQASARATRIRQLYHQLEEKHHGSRWSKTEDMVGFLYDIGELGRMLMAADGRWVYPGNGGPQLEAKLAECLWWLFALSDRLNIDLNHAFLTKLGDLESSLSQSVAKKKAKAQKTVVRKKK